MKTPAGEAEQVRPGRSESDEEAHRMPAESEVLHGNQQRCNKQSILVIHPICSSLGEMNFGISKSLFLPLIKLPENIFKTRPNDFKRSR
jgi:hypothetical protein